MLVYSIDVQHIMKLQPYPFDKIKEGEKIIEVRLYDEKRREIKLGDIIEFKKEPEQAETTRVEVVGLLNYRTFNDLSTDFPATFFGHPNTEDLLKSIFSFYTKEQEEKYSVLGIRIKLLQ
jgi:ASC-1-like (ASCH) protein